MKELSLNELHEKQLDMLCELNSFCKLNGLHYYLTYGTLLGAIRHNGFIPWDDDVDVFLLREDYEKFCSFMQISDKYKIVTREHPHDYYHPFTYCNITDTETIMDEGALANPTGKGVFIDVFPLDNIPDEPKVAARFTRKSKYLIKLRSYYFYSDAAKGIKKALMKMIKLFVNEKSNYVKIQKNALKYKNSTTINVANVIHSSGPDKYIFDKSLFVPITHKFENVELPIPSGYHNILTILYGDYMTPPPPKEQKGSHVVKYYWKNEL